MKNYIKNNGYRLRSNKFKKNEKGFYRTSCSKTATECRYILNRKFMDKVYEDIKNGKRKNTFNIPKPKSKGDKRTRLYNMIQKIL